MIISKQIPLLTTQTLLDMHGAIRKCLKEDDASATKKWFTRERMPARKLNREFMDLSNDIMGEVSATLRRFATPHKRIADKLLSRGTLREKHLQPLLAPVMRDLLNT